MDNKFRHILLVTLFFHFVSSNFAQDVKMFVSDSLLVETKNENLKKHIVYLSKTEGYYLAKVNTLTNKPWYVIQFADKALKIKNGTYIEYDTISQKLVQEINFTHNILHGKYVYYYSNYNLKDSGAYYYGYKKSKWLSKYKNGNLHYYAKFADSFAVPFNTYKNYKGEARSLIINQYLNYYFDSETKVGLWQTYYDNGVKKDSIFYNEGIMQNEAITYYNNGTVESYGKYDNGVPYGKWRWFHANGAKATEELYSNGKIIDLKCSDTLGNLIGENCGIYRLPYFELGETAYQQFLTSKIVEPLLSYYNQKNKLISIQLNINEKGIVTQIEYLTKMNDAAKSIINKAFLNQSIWQPAVSHNRIVASIYTIELVL